MRPTSGPGGASGGQQSRSLAEGSVLRGNPRLLFWDVFQILLSVCLSTWMCSSLGAEARFVGSPVPLVGGLPGLATVLVPRGPRDAMVVEMVVQSFALWILLPSMLLPLRTRPARGALLAFFVGWCSFVGWRWTTGDVVVPCTEAAVGDPMINCDVVVLEGVKVWYLLGLDVAYGLPLAAPDDD